MRHSHSTCLIWTAVALSANGIDRLNAQERLVTVYGLTATLSQIDNTFESSGWGVGASGNFEQGRLRIEADGFWVSMDPDQPNRRSFDVFQLDLRAGYVLARAFQSPVLVVEVGGGRRFVRPSLEAQEIGWLRIGVFSQTVLADLGRIWVRGAFLPVARFSGDGTADLAMEVGLGVDVRPWVLPVRVRGQLDVQRIDRKTRGLTVTNQFASARIGLTIVF